MFKGIRQGCNLSPVILNIYIQQAINDCKGNYTGIKINGERLRMIRFADDIVIVFPVEQNLKRSRI